jgi:hypothetical protein
MNVVQAGPTPVVATAAQAQTRPAEGQLGTEPSPKAVKAPPKSEGTAKYANPQHANSHKTRGSRVDIEA